MAITIDRPPINDRFVDEQGMLTPVWRNWISTFYDSFNGYFTQFGIFLPQLTTIQRNNIINPQEGTVIQNITAGEPQVFNNGAWKNILHS